MLKLFCSNDALIYDVSRAGTFHDARFMVFRELLIVVIKALPWLIVTVKLDVDY